MKNFILLLLIVHSIAYGQDIQTTSQIKAATVFLSGAQVTAVSQVNLPKGISTVYINDVPKEIDQNSILIHGLKNATVRSIGFEINYLSSKKVSENLEKITTQIKQLRREEALVSNTIKGLQDEESLLAVNNRLSNEQQAATLEKVSAFSKYYRERIPAIRMEIFDQNIKLQEIQNNISKLRQEEQKFQNEVKEEKGIIKLKLETTESVSLDLNIQYNIQNAGWYPNYDIKADSDKSLLNLQYKANVYQTTGISWNKIQLTLSTGDPTVNTQKPQLEPHYLNFINPYTNYSRPKAEISTHLKYNPNVRSITGIITESGMPLPGATIIVKGTNIGTSTDFDGRFSIPNVGSGREIEVSFVGLKTTRVPIYSNNINLSLESDMLLEEVVVSGFSNIRSRNVSSSRDQIRAEDLEAPAINITEDNLTQVNFKIAEPYTIPSTSEITAINVDKIDIPAIFEYFAAPIISENVFLTAKVKDWEQYDLLSGEANIYSNGNYIGQTFIDPFQTSEELVISLGIDPTLVIERKQTNNLKDKSLLGSTRIINKNYDINLRNNKAFAVEIVLKDRIPLTQNKEIKIDKINYGDGNFDKDTGIIEWKINVAPKQSIKKTIAYEVKYPKNKRINL